MTAALDNPVVMLIRHAEKPNHAGGPRGITPDGDADRHSLTVTGWTRAGALVGLFAPARGGPPAGLQRPDTVYAPAHAQGHSKRSAQTVSPLAARLGLDVVARYAAGDEVHLAKELVSRPGATVVCWDHDAIHTIATHLGEVTPAPPRHWPSDRYDVVWTFTRDGDRWQFEQVPQLLLPGDLPYPIVDPHPASPADRVATRINGRAVDRAADLLDPGHAREGVVDRADHAGQREVAALPG